MPTVENPFAPHDTAALKPPATARRAPARGGKRTAVKPTDVAGTPSEQMVVDPTAAKKTPAKKTAKGKAARGKGGRRGGRR